MTALASLDEESGAAVRLEVHGPSAGLSAVQGIVRRHADSVEIESAPGKALPDHYKTRRRSGELQPRRKGGATLFFRETGTRTIWSHCSLIRSRGAVSSNSNPIRHCLVAVQLEQRLIGQVLNAWHELDAQQMTEGKDMVRGAGPGAADRLACSDQSEAKPARLV